MSTAQSVTESEHFDYDRARVLHDLSAMRSVDRQRPQSFSVRFVTSITKSVRKLWDDQAIAQELLLEKQAPWLTRR